MRNNMKKYQARLITGLTHAGKYAVFLNGSKGGKYIPKTVSVHYDVALKSADDMNKQSMCDAVSNLYKESLQIYNELCKEYPDEFGDDFRTFRSLIS